MKKIFTILLTLIITIFVCLLCVSFCIKDIVINTISKEIVTKEISSKVIEVTEEVYDDIDYETLEKLETSIGNSEELNLITKKYFDNIVDSIINDADVEVPNTKEDILALINQNEAILKENGIVVTEEQKEKLASKITEGGKIDKVYKNVVTSIRNKISYEEVQVIKAYDRVTKPEFTWTIIAIIIVLTLFIALIKKTYYRWTYDLGIAFVFSGIILSLVAPLMMDIVSIDITEKILGETAEININPLVNLGYGCFSLSALFIIIYIVGNKITRYNERKKIIKKKLNHFIASFILLKTFPNLS